MAIHRINELVACKRPERKHGRPQLLQKVTLKNDQKGNTEDSTSAGGNSLQRLVGVHGRPQLLQEATLENIHETVLMVLVKDLCVKAD